MQKGPARALCFLSTALKIAIHKLTTGHPQPRARQAPNSKRFLQGLWKRVSWLKFIFLLPNEFAYDVRREESRINGRGTVVCPF
jgi:hypothetical protein